jgi:hypothetical protein
MIDDIEIVSESGSELVTTAEAKTYLEVDFSDDDTLIDSLIKSARKFIENYCSISLLAKSVKMIGSGRIEEDLEYYPVDSSTIAVTDENGESVSFLRSGDKKPHVTINGAENTRYTIAYDTIAKTDEEFKTAIKLLTKHLYNHGTIEPTEDDPYYWNAIKLIEPYRLK